MRRSSRSALFLALGASVSVLIFAIAAPGPRQPRLAGDDVGAPMYRCSMDIGGYRVTVRLYATHPFLSEHDKHVSVVSPDGQVLADDVFFNPGGLMAMYFFDGEDELVVMDGMGDAVTIDKGTGAATRAHRPDYAGRLRPDMVPRSAFTDGAYTCLAGGET